MAINAKVTIKNKPDPKKVEEQRQIDKHIVASKEDAILIVNGKQRKIAKKSRYLLDMLTLD